MILDTCCRIPDRK